MCIAVYTLLMLGFALGLAHKLGIVPGLLHRSVFVRESIRLAVWLLPLPALLFALVSDSDTLRAAAIGYSIVIFPIAVSGFLFSLWSFAAIDRESEITVNHYVFAAYETNRQGAFGDVALEVWRERPIALGFRIGQRLPCGGEGYYLMRLEPIDERCVEVHFSRTGRREEITRAVCVEGTR